MVTPVLGRVQGLRLAFAGLRPLRGAFGALDTASARRSGCWLVAAVRSSIPVVRGLQLISVFYGFGARQK
jgi:hypothetical protein